MLKLTGKKIAVDKRALFGVNFINATLIVFGSHAVLIFYLSL
jgi:hypothetical protein